MFHRILIVLGVVSCVLPSALSPTDVLACGRPTAILTAAEQARQDQAEASRRKALQARNIRGIDATLAKVKLSAGDRSKVKDLRAHAAELSESGKLAEADRALSEAWKTLGHPEKFAFAARLSCGPGR